MMSREGIPELAYQVKAIKERRDLSNAEVAMECRGKYEFLGLTKNTIAGLCNAHALRPDFEPWVRKWVEQNDG